ncbi:hypothetical protein D9619_007221 [Psilocybe cf. subviscida]|uniref:Uncharacterized protein n=1 Tax=Psilocybe cf. subviscida TaxID=2480587 RepID=A0A8H5B4B1_9AGAR|nr:hypothetical protein D9619_007221 [Psilocybe cf. subviscida]
MEEGGVGPKSLTHAIPTPRSDSSTTYGTHAYWALTQAQATYTSLPHRKKPTQAHDVPEDAPWCTLKTALPIRDRDPANAGTHDESDDTRRTPNAFPHQRA